MTRAMTAGKEHLHRVDAPHYESSPTTEFYEQIRRRNESDYGRKRLFLASQVGHLLTTGVEAVLPELVQNAEDAGAESFGIQILPGGLLVWNDGRPFSRQDVQSISSLFVSSKDAQSIGHFGIGFKTVLQLSEAPVILSGDFCFRLQGCLDPYPLDETAEKELPGTAWEQWEAGNTVFWLPFQNDPDMQERAERDFEGIRRSMEDTVEDFLLFLNNLQVVEWIDETEGIRKTCIAERSGPDSPGASIPSPVRQSWRLHRVEMLIEDAASVRENQQESEARWLRVEREVTIPEEVVHQIARELRQRRESGGAERWESLGEERLRQRVSVAFRMDEHGRFRPEPGGGRIFVGLPTQQKMGFRFHLSARFAVKLDRTGIRTKDSLSNWAMERVREALGELPSVLKDANLFGPSIWEAMPGKNDVQDPFAAAYGALHQALASGRFIHGADGDLYRTEEVRLAHNQCLYELLSADLLAEVAHCPDVVWVHEELRGRYPRRVVEELGVRTVEENEVIEWLRTKESHWFAARSVEWLVRLYDYFDTSDALREAAKDLPMVRLQSGECVVPGAAAFQPDEDEGIPQPLKPFENVLPLVHPRLMERKDTVGRLHRLGVKEFRTEYCVEVLLKRIYGDADAGAVPNVTPEANREHVRMLFQLWKSDQVSKEWLRQWRDLRFLRARGNGADWYAPKELYIPEDLGGYAEVEKYFEIAGGRPFVLSGYADRGDVRNAEGRTAWREFLQTLGAHLLPMVTRETQHEFDFREDDRANSRSIEAWLRERLPELDDEDFRNRLDGLNVYNATRHYRCIDWEIHGFEEVFRGATDTGNIDTVRTLWEVLARLLQKKNSDQFRYARVEWFYGHPYTNNRIPSLWLAKLLSRPWLPDAEKNLRKPQDLFDPRLRPFLGPGFPYLHDKIPLSGEARQQLAELVEIHLEAKLQEVLDYLEQYSRQNERPENPSTVKEDMGRLYRWLERHVGNTEPDRKREKIDLIRQSFESHPVIFVSDAGWYRASEVCCRDPLGVLPELSREWPNLHAFFVEIVGVAERPNVAHFAEWILVQPQKSNPPCPDASEDIRKWEGALA